MNAAVGKKLAFSRRTSDHHVLAEHQASDRYRDEHQRKDVATPTESGTVARPRAGAMRHRVELGRVSADDGAHVSAVDSVTITRPSARSRRAFAAAFSRTTTDLLERVRLIRTIEEESKYQDRQ